MSNKFQRLDEEHELIIVEKTRALIKWLNENVESVDKYTKFNMFMNVLTGGIVTVAYHMVDEDKEELFIENMALTLRANFDANRKTK